MSRLVGVTGASGHLGGALARRFLASGDRVRAFCHRDLRAIEGLDLEAVRGDLLDPVSLLDFASGCDLVVHSAGVISISGDPDGMVARCNVEGVRNVVEACARSGVARLVHVSSTHAVHDCKDRDRYDETNPYKGQGSFAYDRSKAAGEAIVLSAVAEGRLDACIVRPSSLVGPFDFKPSKVGQAILDLYRGRIPVLPPGGYNFVDVRDGADGIARAAAAGRAGEVYLLSGRYCSMAELAALVERLGGRPAPRLALPFGLLSAFLPAVALLARLARMEQPYTEEMIRALEDCHPNMDNGKARSELGFRTRPLEETVADFLSWAAARSP